MPHAQVGDITLYYEVHGDGPPIVLIPGLGADRRLFFKVIPLLATLSQVIVLDPRGSGQSDKPRSEYSIELMADDIAALLGTLGITSADIVGYSMGGKIALQLAAGHPELVRLQKIPGSSLIDLPGGHLTLVMVHGKVLAEAISSFLSEA